MCYSIYMKLEKYNKDLNYSYTFGAFPTFELINAKSECAIKVVLSTKCKQTDEIKNLTNLCARKNVEIEVDDKTINRLAEKENVFVVGVFKKFAGGGLGARNLVLVNPSDMGNLGTIMRTALGFGFKNLVIVKQAVDHFNPKVVRASMGAIFSLNIAEFDSLDEYLQTKNPKFFFMLNGKNTLGNFETPTKNFDLVFGNEAHGLPEVCLTAGTSVVIKHSAAIDSLNLPISVGIALYEFNKK